MYINSINNKISDNKELSEVSQVSLTTDEQVLGNDKAKERDENGPWTLWSESKASIPQAPCECPDQSEKDHLNNILIRCGNNPEGLPSLLYAILQKDDTSAELLLKHGASPFTLDSDGLSCLFYAIRAGRLKIVQKLIELGVNVDHVFQEHDALWSAHEYKHPDIVRYLENLKSTPGTEIDPPSPYELQQLTLINVKYGNNPEGIPTLHYAILQNDVAAVNLLLKFGASPFTKLRNSFNCLHYAIMAGSLFLVQKFVGLGLSVNPLNEEDDGFEDNPLILAIQHGQNDIAKWMLNNGTKILIRNDHFPNYLIACCWCGNYEMFKEIMERVDIGDYSPYLSHLAKDPWPGKGKLQGIDTFQKRKELIQLLVNRGASVNAGGWDHKQPPLKFTTDPRMIEFLKSLGAR